MEINNLITHDSCEWHNNLIIIRFLTVIKQNIFCFTLSACNTFLFHTVLHYIITPLSRSKSIEFFHEYYYYQYTLYKNAK